MIARTAAATRGHAKLGLPWLVIALPRLDICGGFCALGAVHSPCINRSSCESAQVLLLFHALLRKMFHNRVLSTNSDGRTVMSVIDIKPDAQGKVRDLYDLGDKLLLVASCLLYTSRCV